jgi:hypothetical protein
MKNHLRGNAAQQKYVQFMNDIYQQKIFNRRMMETQYNISHSLCTQLTKRGFIIQFGNDQHKWVGEEPSLALAMEVLKDIRTTNRHYTKKINEKPNQLTIKPIRKAPVTIPQPIVKEAEYDNSNAKMMLIMAAGAIIGFMIATLIWK